MEPRVLSGLTVLIVLWINFPGEISRVVLSLSFCFVSQIRH